MKPVQIQRGRRAWCGPTALSLITGVEYEVAAELLRRIMKRTRAPTGVYIHHMSEALGQLGYDYERIVIHGKPTFAKWLRERPRPYRLKGAVFLLQLTRHYVVVDGRWAGDNHTMGPVRLRKMPHRRRRVQRAWKIEKVRKSKTARMIAADLAQAA